MSAPLSWTDFAAAAPDLAAFGAERLDRPPAYLATVRADGRPRVHPVTPVVAADGLFVFTEPTSPKGHDLRAGRGYALHCGVPDTDGTGGEFWVAGDATPVEDPATRAAVVSAASYEPADRYVLFHLGVTEARCNGYGDVTLPDTRRWSATS